MHFQKVAYCLNHMVLPSDTITLHFGFLKDYKTNLIWVAIYSLRTMVFERTDSVIFWGFGGLNININEDRQRELWCVCVCVCVCVWIIFTNISSIIMIL